MREGRLWGTVLLGYFLLGLPAILLVVLGVLGAMYHGPAPAIALVLGLLGVLALRGMWFELRTVFQAPGVDPIHPARATRSAAAMFLGGLVTFVLVAEIGLSPVVAASITGIAAAVLHRELSIPAYCGAFVGMTSPVVFTAYWHGLVAATIAVCVYLIAQPVFHGVGGKLGTTAFVGATLAIIGTSESFLSDPLPEPEVIGLVVFYAMIAAVGTFMLHVRSPLDPVAASGAVGVLGGLALPLMYPNLGGLLAAGIYAASFAGMSDPSRIPDERWMGLAGIGVGLVLVFTSPYVGGSGGKLGTIAFASCLAVYGLIGTFYRVLERVPFGRLPRDDIT